MNISIDFQILRFDIKSYWIIELAANDNEGIHVLGTVRELSTGIPFDYREKNPQLYTRKAMEDMIDAITVAKTFDERGEIEINLYKIEMTFVWIKKYDL